MIYLPPSRIFHPSPTRLLYFTQISNSPAYQNLPFIRDRRVHEKLLFTFLLSCSSLFPLCSIFFAGFFVIFNSYSLLFTAYLLLSARCSLCSFSNTRPSLHFVRCLLLLACQSLFSLHFSFICYFLVTFITYCSFLGYASFLIDIRSSSTVVFYLTFLLIFYFS